MDIVEETRERSKSKLESWAKLESWGRRDTLILEAGLKYIESTLA